MKNKLMMGLAGAVSLAMAQGAMAACGDVTRAQLEAAVNAADLAQTGGYQDPADLKMWVTMVDETGKVCHVVTSGPSGAAAGNSEWLGSRVISAQKANTANAFSLDGYAISTANLFRTNQDGHDLYGLQHSNPVDASRAYGGSPTSNGTNADFLKNKRIGGVNVFGGGLALYEGGTAKIGAIGVSGDTACRDHAYAWRVRAALSMHPLENGPALGAGLGQPVGSGLGTGITTYNIDKDGNVLPGGMVSGAKYGDEMILVDSSASVSNAYWKDTWSHATCVGSITDVSGDPIAIPANGILLIAP
ncbi:MAG TPA: heme-binding protein [Methylococcaceae bacterium]|nr:heme-binding protein [Methylococcaceae bacterium]